MLDEYTEVVLTWELKSLFKSASILSSSTRLYSKVNSSSPNPVKTSNIYY
jgi:hypothetical protein